MAGGGVTLIIMFPHLCKSIKVYLSIGNPLALEIIIIVMNDLYEFVIT